MKKRAYENGVLKEETIFVYDASAKLIGEYSNQFASSPNAKIAYFANDHLGSPRVNTDINGNVTSRHDYHPYGEEVATSKRVPALGYIDDTVRKQFTGYERDKESDLDFAKARYFKSDCGRFSTPDSFTNDTHLADPQSWNLYAYVRNNPLQYTDPRGTDLVFNYQGYQYKVERATGGSLRLVDSDGKPSEGKQLASVTTMLNNVDSKGGLNNEINRLIKTGSHVMDIGFVSGSDGPGGSTGPSETDPQYTRSGVALNDSSVEMAGESAVVLGTEIASASYLAKKNDLNAAHAYGRDNKGNQVDQFNNDPESPLPGSTTYEQFRAQAASDLRRSMNIAPGRAILPAASPQQGAGSGQGSNPVSDPTLNWTPPAIAQPQQPSKNNTEIQRRAKRK